MESPPAVAEPHETVWGEDGVRVVPPGSHDEHWLAELAEVSAEEAQHMMLGAEAALTSRYTCCCHRAGWSLDGRLPRVVVKSTSQVAQDAEAQ